MNTFDYEDKKRREQEWYEERPEEKTGFMRKLFHHRLIYDPERNSFNYVFPKKQMVEVLQKNRRSRTGSLLIAPCGRGKDYDYLSPYADRIYGIDVSPIAVKSCPAAMEVTVGDILASGYPGGMFDVIASPLFFHHLGRIGFDPFLQAFFRMLKSGGSIVILEPSLWYPMNAVTRPVKRIFGNPYDEVEDEGPFSPHSMLRALRRCGYVNIRCQAASFSHNSFYVPVAKIVNRLTQPFLNVAPLKYFGWMVVYYAEKP